jgi:hypothetical protein
MSVKRYSVSPFLDKLSIKKKTKNIRISTLGSDDNIMINQSTGEINLSNHQGLERDRIITFIWYFVSNFRRYIFFKYFTAILQIFPKNSNKIR